MLVKGQKLPRFSERKTPVYEADQAELLAAQQKAEAGNRNFWRKLALSIERSKPD